MEDISLIQLLKSTQQKTTQNSFGFSEEETAKILQMLQKSEADIKNGRVYSNESVMNEFTERYIFSPYRLLSI